MRTPTRQAQTVCEDLLRCERNDRIEKRILTSEVHVIDRLLGRGLELKEAYKELHSKLSEHPPALKVFFDLLQSSAAFWSPEANQEAREGKARLTAVNGEIETTARKLAQLLEERTHLENHSGFACDTFYHPIDVMHAASERNGSYATWVKESLESVRFRFDLKYWPTLSEMAESIAVDAAQAKPSPHDAVTGAGTEGPRGGLADSFRAFFACLDESSSGNHGLLPQGFDLTDRSIASLMSCALGLEPDRVVNSMFVKRLRQRQRGKAELSRGAPRIRTQRITSTGKRQWPISGS